ncbi:hypothetical protein Plhal304r1_c068g0156451 [Plasmopara halstedii]
MAMCVLIKIVKVEWATVMTLKRKDSFCRVLRCRRLGSQGVAYVDLVAAVAAKKQTAVEMEEDQTHTCMVRHHLLSYRLYYPIVIETLRWRSTSFYPIFVACCALKGAWYVYKK